MLTLLTCLFILDHVTLNLVTSTVHNDIFSASFAAGALRAVDPQLGNSCLRIVSVASVLSLVSGPTVSWLYGVGASPTPPKAQLPHL